MTIIRKSSDDLELLSTSSIVLSVWWSVAFCPAVMKVFLFESICYESSSFSVESSRLSRIYIRSSGALWSWAITRFKLLNEKISNSFKIFMSSVLVFSFPLRFSLECDFKLIFLIDSRSSPTIEEVCWNSANITGFSFSIFTFLFRLIGFCFLFYPLLLVESSCSSLPSISSESKS